MDKGIENKDITRPRKPKKARGQPGAKPHWASGAKTIVGTAVPAESRIWYTIDNGTISEIYHPDVDQANTRSVRFAVTGDDNFFSDEIWDAQHTVEWIAPGAPACRIESRSKDGTYRLTKEIVPDPTRDTLLVRGHFQPEEHKRLRLYLIVDAHIGDCGANNEAWAGQYKDLPMVFAQRASVCFAVACSPPPRRTSVGYIGTSDGFTVLRRGDSLPEANYAPDGNVAMTLEIDYGADGNFVIALAGGADSGEAGQQARAGLLEDFETTRDLFLRQWSNRQAQYRDLRDLSGHPIDMYRVSTAVLETHQSKRFPGGFVASLSVPWGFARGDKDIGGYHVVWPRDMVEIAMGKLACGDAQSAPIRALLSGVHAERGRRMEPEHVARWNAALGEHPDGCDRAAHAARDKVRRERRARRLSTRSESFGMQRVFFCATARSREQDRWETTPGYSPNTMAAEVAALLAAAEFAELEGAHDRAQFLRETADAWNDAIDELTYVEDTPLAQRYGVRGYYLRMAPPRRIEARAIGHLRIRMPNVRSGPKSRRAVDVISPGALSLVTNGTARAG